jgi:UDP-N-acetylmuramyl pentapeptide phosphotransferase/UDP-N-acetylglucosamine-1-phosphate transferase
MNATAPLWVIVFWATLSAIALTALFAAVSRRSGILLDQPNQRSLHHEPTPRIGGIGMWFAIAVTATWSASNVPGAIAVPVLLVASVSLLDDWRAQPIALRLAVQFLSALVALSALYPGSWLIALLAVAVVWSANLFNFMDGADGLAAGMALVGFATLGWLACEAHHDIGPIALIIASAAGGVLLLNFPPARVFLGDAGSIPLGFVAALISLWGARDDLWPIWLPVLVFLPFVLDATFTLGHRVWRGERFWLAHREHLYQRLVLSGWTHKRLFVVAMPIILSCSVLALLILRMPQSWKASALAGVCLCLATLYVSARMWLARSSD